MSDQRARRATSQDVAREAGVSRTTVSFVLNQAPHQTFPAATRQRVLDAAEKLGYAPSVAARTLRTGRSEVVLALLPDWPIGHTVGDLLDQMSRAFESCGFAFVVHPRTRSPLSEVWKRITPTAVVTFDALSEQELADIEAAGIEVTLAMFHGSVEQTRSVAYVDEQLGSEQVRHLVGSGHRQLGYAYPADARLDYFAVPRLAGVRQACEELQLAAPRVATVRLDAVDAAAAVRAWRAGSPSVTAVCAYNDEVALALLAGLAELGLSCPDDLSVIGLDNIPAAGLVRPPLTTLSRSMADHAHRISEAVLSELGRTPPWDEPVVSKIHVIERRSVRRLGDPGSAEPQSRSSA